MRYIPMAICLILITAASVSAAPWSRSKNGTSSRHAEQLAQWGWVDERDLGPYRLRSEFPLLDVQELVLDLGDLQRDLESTLRLECHPEAIQIHLFNSRRTYDQYLKLQGYDAMNRQALYIPSKDSGRIYAYRQRELDIDVRHESTHALLHSALPYVPIWIDEGLAEYFEVRAPLREEGHPHRKELRHLIASPVRFHRWKPNIESLEAKRKLSEMDGNDYRDSWGIVHFLLHGPDEAREALTAYFEEIQSGNAPLPLSKQLRKRIPNLESAIIEHLR